MTNLFLEIIILFILLLIYFSTTNSRDNNNWLRAVVLAIAIPLLIDFLPSYIGILGWFIGIIIILVLISKMLGQSITGSLLFLLVIGIVEYIIRIGIYQYIHWDLLKKTTQKLYKIYFISQWFFWQETLFILYYL